MKTDGQDLPELRDIGANLQRVRIERGYNQGRLARECKLSQAQVSLFEAGRREPSLDQFIRLARALGVPLQRLLTGADRPGVALKDLVFELRLLGAADLWVSDAIVPGAVRRPEEVIALAVSARSPDPRIIETIPALLSWNEIQPALLRAYGIVTKTTYRLAWLAEVALAIDRRKGFPEGCRREQLERFLKAVKLPPEKAVWDDFGRPGEALTVSPVGRRWKINYGAKSSDFEQRARELTTYRVTGRVRTRTTTKTAKEVPVRPKKISAIATKANLERAKTNAVSPKPKKG